MPRPGYTMPVVDKLAELGFVAIDGSCIVTDPRGTGRYCYVLIPLTASTWSFGRIDLLSQAVQGLATPVRAATTITERARMVFDPSGGILAEPTIWLFNPESAATWFRWQSYSIANDVWTPRSSVLAGLAAAPTIDVNLCHPCNLLGAAPGPDRWIYANGDAGVWGGAGLSNLAVYDITTDTWARVTGGGGVRAAAPAIGSSLNWIPQVPGYLFSFRGGGAGILDVYGIVADAWTAIAAAAINPGVTWDQLGFETTTNPLLPWKIICARGGNISALDLTSLVIPPAAATNDLLATVDGDGVSHRGNGMFSWNVGNRKYIGIRPHSGTSVQRIRLIE